MLVTSTVFLFGREEAVSLSHSPYVLFAVPPPFTFPRAPRSVLRPTRGYLVTNGGLIFSLSFIFNRRYEFDARLEVFCLLRSAMTQLYRPWNQYSLETFFSLLIFNLFLAKKNVLHSYCLGLHPIKVGKPIKKTHQRGNKIKRR